MSRSPSTPELETVLKINLVEKSSQPAELDSDHGDKNERFRAGDSGFIVADQSPVMHQPGEGALDHPATRQHFKPAHIVRVFDHFDSQLGPVGLDPVSKLGTGVTPINSQEPKPRKPRQHPEQDRLGSVPFGGVCGGDPHPENQPQSVHHQMTFAAFNAFARIVAHFATMSDRLDALAVQDRGGGLAAFALRLPDQDAQSIVEDGPQIIALPTPVDTVDRLPRGQIGGQIPPGDAAFDDI